MSNERIDHAAEAVDLCEVGIESMELKQLTHAQVTFTLAQVNATLALVEQQRVANLIAAGVHEVNEPVPTIPGARRLVLKPEIAAALGVER